MNILICKDYLSVGGITTFIMHLQNALKDNHRLHLLCTHYKGNFYDEAKGYFDSTFVLEQNINVIKRAYHLLKIINDLQPDLIILNDSPLINMISPLIDKKIKIISVIHSDDNRYYRQGTFFNPWIDLYVCPSPKLKKILVDDYNIKKDKITVIPHGVEIAKIQRLKKENSIVFIGNLDVHKGCDMLIPIFSKILNEIPLATLTIVGEGPYFEKINYQINNYDGFRNNVKLIPRISHDEIYAILEEKEILLFPSKLESYAYVIPEAMTNEVIPVVSLLEDITDQFINHGNNGFLCPVGDINGFGDTIINILKNKNKDEISKLAKQTVDRNFSINLFEKNYNSIIHNFKKMNTIKRMNFLNFYLKSLLGVLKYKISQK